MKRVLAVCAVALWVMTSGIAWAQVYNDEPEADLQAYYMGAHPIHPDFGGGFCSLGGSHSHSYAPDPDISYLFRNLSEHWHFVGNPYWFGYTLPAYAHFGHHPIPRAHGGGWCYMDGKHHHNFTPNYSRRTHYRIRDGVYYYVGQFGPLYNLHRARYYRRTHGFHAKPMYSRYWSRRNIYKTRYGKRAQVRYYRRYKPRKYPRVRRHIRKVLHRKYPLPFHGRRPIVKPRPRRRIYPYHNFGYQPGLKTHYPTSYRPIPSHRVIRRVVQPKFNRGFRKVFQPKFNRGFRKVFQPKFNRGFRKVFQPKNYRRYRKFPQPVRHRERRKGRR